MRSQKGITLLELIICMSIVAIMATAAVPSFVKFIQNSALRTTTREFITQFRVMQSRAVTENGYYRMWVKDEATYWVEKLIVNDWIPQGNIMGLSRVKIVDMNTDTSRFQFRPDGGASVASFLTLKGSGKSANRIDINVSGKVTVSSVTIE